MPECPDCEREFKGRECPTCHWRPEPAATETREAKYELCGWNADTERPCPFVAVMWPSSAGRDSKGRNNRRGFCQWHFEVLGLPRLENDYEEFERFLPPHRATCSQFAHHDAGYLWETFRNPPRAKISRDVAQPCRIPECWVWESLEDEGLALPWIRPGTPRSFQGLIAEIAKRKAVA